MPPNNISLVLHPIAARAGARVLLLLVGAGRVEVVEDLAGMLFGLFGGVGVVEVSLCDGYTKNMLVNGALR